MEKDEMLKGLTRMIEVSRLKSDLSDYAVLVAARDIAQKSDIVDEVSVDDEWKKRLVKLGLFGSVKSVNRAIKEGLIKVSTEIEVGDESDDDVCCDGCEFEIDEDLNGILITPDMEPIVAASMLATAIDTRTPFDLSHKMFTIKELQEIASHLLTYVGAKRELENGN